VLLSPKSGPSLENSVCSGAEIHGTAPESTTGPFGLDVVFAPSDAKALVDIIFIHGLGGHSQKTWTSNHDPGTFWPGRWLPQEPDLCPARILTFGYNAAFKGSTKSVATVTDFAKELLHEMRFSRDAAGTEPLNLGSRPIIFVVHSMGGLVAKKAYLLGLHDETYKDIAKAVSAMIFLSTPHRGSNLAETLKRVLAATLQAPKSFISDLCRNSVTLEELNEQFRHVAPDLCIWSFYETQETSIGPLKMMVLEKDSSSLGYPGEISCPLHADHRGVCKYGSPNDSNYKSVRNSIATAAAAVLDQAFRRGKLVQPAQPFAVEEFLRDWTALGDDYRKLCQQRMPGTCTWLLEDPEVVNCLGKPSKSQVLWYTATPGSGKSVLAAFTVAYLQQSRRHCQFFFFKQSENFKALVTSALRSITAQLAEVMPSFKARLLSSSLENLALESGDASLIWHNVFERALFGCPATEPMFWILDAIDECDSPTLFLESLASLATSNFPITVIIFSRHSNKLSESFDKLSRRIPVAKISEPRIHSDIELFVSRELERCSGSDQFLQGLKAGILRRARNSFLWAKLALREIMDCHTEAAMTAVLDGIPLDMVELYRLMEQNILASIRRVDKPLVKALIEWTMCAERSLNVSELSEALSPEFTGLVDLRMTISRTCGHFLQVDDAGRIELLHHTAREYFKSDSSLEVGGEKSHGRLFYKAMSALQDPNLRISLLEHGRALQERKPYVFYAAACWPYHLEQWGCQRRFLPKALVEFLRGDSILSWIHCLALSWRLDVLVRASSAIALVAKTLSTSGSTTVDQLFLSSLRVDLLKLIGRFGRQIMDQPSILYEILPAFCPRLSSIHQQFHRSSSQILVRDPKGEDWSDILGRLCTAENVHVWDVQCAVGVVAALASSGTVYMWDPRNLMELGRIPHASPVISMAISENGCRLATYSSKTTRLWSLPDGTLLASVPSPTHSRILSMTFSSHHDGILAGCTDNAVRFWASGCLQNGWGVLLQDVPRAASHATSCGTPTHVQFNSRAETVATSCRDAPLSVWRLSDGKLVKQLLKLDLGYGRQPYGDWFQVRDFTWNAPTGHIIGVHITGEVFKWHPISDEALSSQRVAHEVAVSPGGRVFATYRSSGVIQIWNFSAFSVVHELFMENLVLGLCFSPDGSRLYDWSGSVVSVWDPPCLTETDGEPQTLSPNGDLPIDTTIRHGDGANCGTGTVTATSVSPCGHSYCAGYEDGTVLLFRGQADQGIQICCFSNCLGATLIAWSPGSDVVACSDLVGEIKVVSLRGAEAIDERLTHHLLPEPKSDFDGDVIQDIIFPHAGSTVLITTLKSVRLFSVQNGALLSRVSLETQPERVWVSHVRFPLWLLAFGANDVLLYDGKTLADIASIPYARSPSQTYNSDVLYGEKTRDGCELGTVSITWTARYILLLEGARPTPWSTFQYSLSRLFDVEDLQKLCEEGSGSQHGGDTPAKQLKYIRLPSQIAQTVRKPLRIFMDSQFVFIDDNLWLRSYQLPVRQRRPWERQPVQPDVISRHYFVPLNWLGAASMEQCGMSADGTLFWPRDDRVVRVQCDLETLVMPT